MVAILKRMGVGFPGGISRSTSSITLEPIDLDQTTGTPTTYGVPLKVVNGKARAMGAGDAATVFAGFLARVYPSSAPFAAGNEGLNLATPNPIFTHDRLRRGYMYVALSPQGGTAAKDGQVYLRVATAGTGKPIGGLEAVADGANTVALPGVQFMGPAGADGITEIAINI